MCSLHSLSDIIRHSPWPTTFDLFRQTIGRRPYPRWLQHSKGKHPSLSPAIARTSDWGKVSIWMWVWIWVWIWMDWCFLLYFCPFSDICHCPRAPEKSSDNFESLDENQMKSTAQYIVYSGTWHSFFRSLLSFLRSSLTVIPVDAKYSLNPQESSLIPVINPEVQGYHILWYDKKENAVNCRRSVHLRNLGKEPLANGVVSVEAGGCVQFLYWDLLPFFDFFPSLSNVHPCECSYALCSHFAAQTTFPPLFPGDDFLLPYADDNFVSITDSYVYFKNINIQTKFGILQSCWGGRQGYFSDHPCRQRREGGGIGDCIWKESYHIIPDGQQRIRYVSYLANIIW